MSPRPVQAQPAQPSRPSTPTKRRSSMPTPTLRSPVEALSEEERARMEKALSKCEQQQRVLDILCIDFDHLKALVGRVVHISDGGECCDSSNFADLLERLRGAIMKARG